MNKTQLIFLTDGILIPVFALSLWSGVELHIAGHGAEHGVWHIWAVFHTIASLLFLILAAIHVKSHWGWYKSLVKGGLNGRRGGVLLLSAAFLLVAISGLLLLLCIDGANSSPGLLHYKAGLVLGVLSIAHILQRRKILYNGFWTHVLKKSEFREYSKNI